MSESIEYFFAVLDNELLSGKSSIDALVTATDNYRYVYLDQIKENTTKKSEGK